MALNLVKLQDDLKMMPNQAIIAYANGANPMIPPFVALGELNRRKKLQESAQAEQAKEMAGAPTVKEQIEQSAGIAGLQPQMPQAMPQQAPQGMPMQQPMMQAPMQASMAPQAPVAQMAYGGAVDDYALDGGIASLQVPDNMYNEDNFAGGGIVAFSGEDGSFVETSPGFYEMQESDFDIDESKLSPYERMIFRELRRRQAEPSVQERRAAFGLANEAPDTTARARAELERRQAELEKEPDFFDRILALQPGRFGSGVIGESVRRSELDRKTKLDEVLKLRAAAEDQRAAAEASFKEGRFAESERERDRANALYMESIKLGSELARNKAQIAQAEAAAKAAGRPQYMEQVYADLKSGDPERIKSAMIALGQSKTGEITEAKALQEWNDMSTGDKLKLSKLNPPVRDFKEYYQYLLKQGPYAPTSGAAPAQSGSRPPISSFNK